METKISERPSMQSSYVLKNSWGTIYNRPSCLATLESTAASARRVENRMQAASTIPDSLCSDVMNTLDEPPDVSLHSANCKFIRSVCHSPSPHTPPMLCQRRRGQLTRKLERGSVHSASLSRTRVWR